MVVGLGAGDAPGWLTAIGTVGTFAVAFGLLKNEIDERRRTALEAEARERRAQAELVAAWCVGVRPYPPDQTLGSPVVVCRNMSHLPIFQVTVYALAGWPPPTEGGRVGSSFNVIPPGDDVEGTGPLFEIANASNPPIELQFTDASRRHWKRDAYGVLTELGEAQAAQREMLREAAYPPVPPRPPRSFGATSAPQDPGEVSTGTDP